MSPASDAGRVAEAVALIVSAWPALSDQQVDALRGLFAPVPRHDPLGPAIDAALRARPQRVARRGI